MEVPRQTMWSFLQGEAMREGVFEEADSNILHMSGLLAFNEVASMQLHFLLVCSVSRSPWHGRHVR